MALNIAAKSDPSVFKKALNKLSTDHAFREKAMTHPETLTNEFHLSLKDLHALRQAAVLSGADMKAITRVRATEMAHMVSTNQLTDIDIDISCCCCCCCGETSVVRTFA